MRYYIIAGEASGDLHAGNLVKALRTLDPGAVLRGWGGERMESEGVTISKHYRELAFMGFAEVLANLRTILRNFRECKQDIIDFKPDAVILVDYPGFNLRMAAWLKAIGIPVFYYISPQIWAWKQSRVHKIKRYVDRMIVILPFEEAFYGKYGYEADFVGHPLLDAIASHHHKVEDSARLLTELSADGRPVVALLPGSRVQEVKVMLPVMLRMSKAFPEQRFIVGEASALPVALYDELCRGYDVGRLRARTYDLLSVATAAAVTSGTASLEAALFRVPLVIGYKAGFLSYQIARRIVKIRFIGLANLIMDRAVLKELIQGDYNTRNLKQEMARLLRDNEYRERILSDLDELREKLGGPGASQRAAKLVFGHLCENKMSDDQA